MLKREESLKLIAKVFKDRIHMKRIKCTPYSPLSSISLFILPLSLYKWKILLYSKIHTLVLHLPLAIMIPLLFFLARHLEKLSALYSSLTYNLLSVPISPLLLFLPKPPASDTVDHSLHLQFTNLTSQLLSSWFSHCYNVPFQSLLHGFLFLHYPKNVSHHQLLSSILFPSVSFKLLSVPPPDSHILPYFRPPSLLPIIYCNYLLPPCPQFPFQSIPTHSQGRGISPLELTLPLVFKALFALVFLPNILLEATPMQVRYLSVCLWSTLKPSNALKIVPSMISPSRLWAPGGFTGLSLSPLRLSSHHI